jgi:hypothetical protein
MALTVSKAPVTVSNLNTYDSVKFLTAEVTFDNSYPTGGLAITPASLGLSSIILCVPFLKTATSVAAGQATHPYFNTATGKLQLFKLNAEVANATDTSLVVVQLFVIGL